MNRQPGRNQRSVTRSQFYGVVETGTQVKSGRARGGISRERKFLPNARSRILTSIFFIITGHDLVE